MGMIGLDWIGLDLELELDQLFEEIFLHWVEISMGMIGLDWIGLDQILEYLPD